MVKPAKLAMNDVCAAEAESFLTALANRHRLMILYSLRDGELPVGELHERLPLSQSSLSQHLAILRNANLVATHRTGKFIHYHIISERVRPVLSEIDRLFHKGRTRRVQV